MQKYDNQSNVTERPESGPLEDLRPKTEGFTPIFPESSSVVQDVPEGTSFS